MRLAGCFDGMILTLDAALGGCGAGVVAEGRVLAVLMQSGGRGSAAALPGMVQSVLRLAGVDAGRLAGVAVTVGPGSFTGVRAALALAQGIGLAAGVPVWGVSVGGAIRALADGEGRAVWVVVDNKRGRVFLDWGGGIAAVGLGDLPVPEGAVAVAGDAAVAVASRLAARGDDVMLLAARGVEPLGIALAAGRALPARPIYVDGVAARVGGGMRPAPV